MDGSGFTKERDNSFYLKDGRENILSPTRPSMNGIHHFWKCCIDTLKGGHIGPPSEFIIYFYF
jgi:hypothetical protein